MEYLLGLLLGGFFAGFFGYMFGYDKGYAAREDKFQKVPITYAVGLENAAYVENVGSKTRITIYNENLVELIRPKK